MRVGGQAEWLLEPANPQELKAAVAAAQERGGRLRLLGGGANLLVSDGLLPGVVIATERMRRVFRPLEGLEHAAPLGEAGSEWPLGEVSLPALDGRIAQAEPALDPRLIAWCGASMPSLLRVARDLGLSGLEGLIGVPGSLGGGVAMNAGGRWGEMWDVIESVSVLDLASCELRELARATCSPKYRNGNLGEMVVIGAVLRLRPDAKASIQERQADYLAQKRAAQPVTEWSAGCIFKNPDRNEAAGRTAGRLIEECGGKGLSRGDAMVSPLHGNFIVNRGQASATDVFALIADIQRLVQDRSGIALEREVRVWGMGEESDS